MLHKYSPSPSLPPSLSLPLSLGRVGVGVGVGVLHICIEALALLLIIRGDFLVSDACAMFGRGEGPLEFRSSLGRPDREILSFPWPPVVSSSNHSLQTSRACGNHDQPFFKTIAVLL